MSLSLSFLVSVNHLLRHTTEVKVKPNETGGILEMIEPVQRYARYYSRHTKSHLREPISFLSWSTPFGLAHVPEGLFIPFSTLVLSKFSVKGQAPNISGSAVYLVSAVTHLCHGSRQ